MIWLDSFTDISYEHKQQLYKLINGKSDIKSVIELNKDNLVILLGEDKYKILVDSARPDYFSQVLDSLYQNDQRAVTIVSSDYPELLKQIDTPPLVLYCSGNVKLFTDDCFGIVGSRKSFPLSISLAEKFTEELLNAKFTLVTGIAEGVENRVINTVLSKNSKIISVLPGGIENVYPQCHTDLVKSIIEKGGLVISEYPPKTPVVRYNFPVRNRIMAGLSKGVLIISGGAKSGTLYTAEYAGEYGRDVFAIPYSVGVASGVGCNEVIKKGGILVDSPKDILDYYGIECETQKVTLLENEKEIARILIDGSMHVEQLSAKLNKRVFEILPTLSIMEIKGLVVKTGVNVYGLTRTDLEE